MRTRETIKHVARVTVFAAAALAASGCGDETTAPAPSEQETEAVTARAEAEPLPPIEQGPLRIEPGGYDFGAIGPDSDHQARFTLHNTGTSIVTILDVRSTCVCTAPEDVANRVIAPGDSLSFTASFDAPNEAGDKSSEMRLVFRSDGQSYVTQLRLRGTVTMAIRAEPAYVDALEGKTDGVVEISSLDGRPFRVLSSNGEAPEFADAADPASDAPRSVYRIAWHVPDRSTSGCAGARLWWIIETDHPECPILPLRIRHECTGAASDPYRAQRGWTFGSDAIVQLGAITAGEPVEVDVEFFNRKKVAITGVESLTPDASAELVSYSEGDGMVSICRVRFTPAPTAHGMLYAMVLFKSPTGAKDVAFVAKVE